MRQAARLVRSMLLRLETRCWAVCGRKSKQNVYYAPGNNNGTNMAPTRRGTDGHMLMLERSGAGRAQPGRWIPAVSSDNSPHRSGPLRIACSSPSSPSSCRGHLMQLNWRPHSRWVSPQPDGQVMAGCNVQLDAGQPQPRQAPPKRPQGPPSPPLACPWPPCPGMARLCPAL